MDGEGGSEYVRLFTTFQKRKAIPERYNKEQ
jgi:hypothetical protein